MKVYILMSGEWIGFSADTRFVGVFTTKEAAENKAKEMKSKDYYEIIEAELNEDIHSRTRS